MVSHYKMLDGEFWWGGSSADGPEMPFGAESEFHADYRKSLLNQGMPLLLSSLGRYIWSETPFKIDISGGEIRIESDDDVSLTAAGTCLRDAYLSASAAHFPFSGKVPREEFFTTAQYNTWMEFTYQPTQEKVLEYARSIIRNGFVPGILIIDEGWHRPYGDWSFDRQKFPDPKEMIRQLHEMNFKVMLWVTPWVTCSGLSYITQIRQDLNREGSSRSIFMRTENGDVALCSWWNGVCALLDMTDGDNCRFLESQLRVLMQEYGVDGFKFDGGSMTQYDNDAVQNGCFRGTSDGTYSPMAQNIAWNEFGAQFEFHEYKDTFKGGGKPTIQRLRDRNHTWTGDGINTILPSGIVQGLLGYPFICPDMVGGGEWTYSVMPGFQVDEELFIRMAQASVFFPMMQFSWAPWRVLSEKSLQIVSHFGRMHGRISQELCRIIRDSAKTGEPVVRSLEYAFPHCGYEKITDEFLCGDDILVCPVVTKGTFEKDVVIPEGTWRDELGNIFTKGTYRIPTPVERLPWLRKMK